MRCPAPLFFLMFWGQIGVKFNFFRKMNHFIYCENTNKKARSLDKVPKLRAFPARSYLSDNCSWLREPDLNWRPSGYEIQKMLLFVFFTTENKEKQRFFMPFLWYIPLFLLFSVLVRVCIRVRNDEFSCTRTMIFTSMLDYDCLSLLSSFSFLQIQSKIRVTL